MGERGTKKTPVRLGIDFGTTRTVVACVDRGNYPVVDFADEKGDAASYIPSIVAERGGELRFGFEAAAVADDPEFTVVPSFKRLLSRPEAGPAQTVRVGSVVLRVGDLITRFLEYVRRAIAERSTFKQGLSAGDVPRVVVAVPANAHGAQRFVTLDAFRRAGFHVLAMLNEPSAAGFEYTHRHRSTLSSKRDVVVVYDLGGGTFDASVVRMTGTGHEVLATAGLGQLGGDDFDRVLADLALARAGLELPSLPARAAQDLLLQCREAKERLHPNSRKITLDLEALLGAAAPRPELTVSVSEFYEACMPLVDRTIDAMLPVMSRVDQEAAAPDLTDIAGVYVVGGASELPIVSRALRDRFGRRVHRSPYPSAAVAVGLAIAADEGAAFGLSDRYSRTFGVFREGADGREITFDPIFLQGTLLPHRTGAVDAADDPGTEGPERRVTQTRTYHPVHNVGHFRFVECAAVDEEGKPRGDMTLCGDVYFPFDPRLAATTDLAAVEVERWTDQGPSVLERYCLDDSGMVEVQIRDLDTGLERTYRLGAA